MSATKLQLTALANLRLSSHLIPSHNLLPNTIQSRPLLIYHQAYPPSTSASALESHLTSVGVVVPQWRYTMYSTTHFHSTTHEVLCVYSGRVRLCFGGEENPGRLEVDVGAGDAIVVPAGVGHRLLEDRSPGGDGFQMVGSYPKGFSWDMCYGKAGEEAKVEKIKDLKWFERDPLYGDDGPVLHVTE